MASRVRGRVGSVAEVRDRVALRGERGHEPSLVRVAAMAEGLDAWVLAELDALAGEAGAVELGEVAAGEVVRDVGGGEEEGGVAEAHGQARRSSRYRGGRAAVNEDVVLA
jgi:hypothetical protein